MNSKLIYKLLLIITAFSVSTAFAKDEDGQAQFQGYADREDEHTAVCAGDCDRHAKQYSQADGVSLNLADIHAVSAAAEGGTKYDKKKVTPTAF